MSKKLSTLIFVVLLLGLSNVALTAPIEVQNHSFELMYEDPYNPSEDPNSWILIQGHTGMEAVAAWTNVGNWLGVDTYCPYADWTPDHCWDIGGEVPDGINICYSQHGKKPPIYFYQVLDHEVTNGMMYTLKFDAMSLDDLYYDVALFWAEADGTGADDPANEFYIESLYCGPIAPGVDPEDWNIYYSPDGVIVWGYGPDAFDKTLVYVVDDNPSYVGKKLGIKFYCTGGSTDQFYWGFLDNVRLDGELAIRAYNPVPGEDESDISLELTELSWNPGLWANKHDVYFSTNFEDVNSRSPSAYKGHYVDVNTWALDVALEIAKTYYWAVDESADDYTGAPYPGPWPGKVWTFYTNDGTALNLYPQDSADMIPVDVVLSWMPGIGATQIGTVAHQVYFGTSFDDVNNANDSDTSGIYRGEYAYDVNTYVPQVSSTPELILGQDYYWRVDEVNGPNLWKGHVWTFRGVDYHVIEDFERYGGTSTLRKVWIDGWTNDTGSQVTLEKEVVRDRKAMRFAYLNDYPYYAYYSEADAETYPGSGSRRRYLSFGPDWTVNGAQLLSLWFYGYVDNDAEQMYLALEDTGGHSAEIPYYGDMNDIKLEQWQEWKIGLEDFTAVNPSLDLSNIKRIYLGIGDRDNPQPGGDGKVWFDDIRLYPPVETAFNPRPGDGQKMVPLDVVLKWNPGFYAALHDVYFGTNFDDVAQRSPAVYKGAQDSNTYDPGILEQGRTYYWAVDEVNGADIWPGSSWSFETFYTAVPPIDYPRRWYMLDDGSGPIAYDDGTDFAEGFLAAAPNDPQWEASSSPAGDYSLYFDGREDDYGDYVTIPNWHLDTDTLTITAWVRGDAYHDPSILQTGGAGIVFARDIYTNHGTGLFYGWDTNWQNNNELAYVWDEFYYEFHSGLIVPENLWTFVALVVQPDEATLYMKPIFGDLSHATNFAPHLPIWWEGIYLSKLGDDLNGSDYNNQNMDGNCFWGYMSDVRIYGYALSAGEILYLAQLY